MTQLYHKFGLIEGILKQEIGSAALSPVDAV